MLNVYADESCKDAHRYLVIGGLAIEHACCSAVEARLKEVRGLHNNDGEVKWTKTTRYKLPFYKAFVDVFFEHSANSLIHFHALYVDTRTFNHKAWNRGDPEIGFHKLIYQLLLHRVGRRYGDMHRLYVHLDKRATRHHPDSMLPMLNADLARRWGIASDPFRRITFQDSASSDLIQLNDLLIGMVGYLRNAHHRTPDCAAHKKELAWYIVGRARALEHPLELNSRHAQRFAIWPFAFQRGVLGT
jgi:hypothetical protein